LRRLGGRRASRQRQVHVRERRRLRRRVAPGPQARHGHLPKRGYRQLLLRTVEERTTDGLRRARPRQPQVLRTIQKQSGIRLHACPPGCMFCMRKFLHWAHSMGPSRSPLSRIVVVVVVVVVDIDFTLPFTRCRYCCTLPALHLKLPSAHLGSGVDSSDTC